jgi:hypothetical protein
MSVFTVTGERRYSDSLLQTDTLKFESSSKLVLAPRSTDKVVPGPRTLTIVADKIEITDQAEITYDLDNRSGFDPDTPAPSTTSTAPNGLDGMSISGEGVYPRAEDGGDGRPGRTGAGGIRGLDAPTLQIFADNVSSGLMKINFKGQDGGKGGNGGNGGKGGDGQKGAASTISDSWYDGEECTREPGRGGNGGRGGDAGYPGRGGDGGKGGIVKVFVAKGYLTVVQGWTYVVRGGKGGDPGRPGREGAGGKGGKQGEKNGPCPVRSEYRGSDGKKGQTMTDIDSNWATNFKGKDGEKGYWDANELRSMPG